MISKVLNVDINPGEIATAAAKLSGSPKALKSALRRAAKRSGTFMRRAMVESTTREYYIKPGKVRSALYINYTQDALNIFVRSGRWPTLASYYLTPRKRPKGRQRGIYGAVKRGGIKHIPHGFLLRDNLPFIRVGRGKKDIEAVYSPSVSQIVRNPENLEEISEQTRAAFVKNFNHEVLYELGAFKK